MTTTALVAAGVLATVGAAQAKPKLVVGGYVEAGVGAADNEAQLGSRVAVDVFHDAEIFFKGSVKLDNGIKIRTRIELEGQTGKGGGSPNNSNDIIDEAYMAISGKFGEIRLGSEDNAAHLMVTRRQGSWATNVGQNTSFDVADWVETPSGHRAGTVNRLDLGDGDTEKLTYFTPRISGFRAGVTYSPLLANEGGNSSPELRSAGNHEGWAIAADFQTKFDKVGLGIAAGYAVAKPAAGSSNSSDPKGFAIGGTVDVGAFRVAAGWSIERSLTSNTASQDRGSSAIDLGARYKAGKNNFSIGYQHVEDEADRATAANDETDILLVSYRRDLGPGVQYRLNFMWGDYEGENAGSADDNDGVAVTTSVRLAF
jgi:hypothetical protein